MNFNTSVDKDVVDDILESSLWDKAGVKVGARIVEAKEDDAPLSGSEKTPNDGEIGDVEAYSDGVANEYEEPTTLDGEEDYRTDEDAEEEKESFSLADLQVVLDNLADEDLMEHATNMLEVFDVAYETLSESDDEEEEEDYEEEA